LASDWIKPSKEPTLFKRGGKIAVTASLRDDPLGKLHARRQIDDAQYRVGLMLTEYFELAEIGSVQAVDPSKEPVDGRGQYVDVDDASVG
jgi:hypothetical protein